jgi:hypothetical protein
MVSAVDLLAHLEHKFEAAVASGEGVAEQVSEIARFVREIAEAALVRGDDVTLGEARRLASRLAPFFAAAVPEGSGRPVGQVRTRIHTCPRCGQRFRRPVGRLAEVGALLCADCAAELLAGIRL